MAGQGEGEIGERVALAAVDGVLPVEAGLGADLLVAVEFESAWMFGGVEHASARKASGVIMGVELTGARREWRGGRGGRCRCRGWRRWSRSRRSGRQK